MTNSTRPFGVAPVTGLTRHVACALLAATLAVCPGAARAQQEVPAELPVTQMSQAQVGDTVTDGGGVTPGGAFLRAALIPGWGHASIGSYTRGAFYFAAQATTGWGFLRTQLRIDEARDRAAFREAVIRSREAALGHDTEVIDQAVDDDEILQDLNDLAGAREDEREDWAALGIFLMFLSGADAFVSAHLKDFPTPITLDAAPLPGGRVELRLGVGLPH